MRLKSLQLQGFKSFADKTVIDFHPGVTGIVGPNGCGKSNVVDAIKWVLGETSAKALRGGEMADCIFNGTDRRQPHSLAEVTLTFADCETLGLEYNEIGIARRVYRDGKGEYLLNGTPCRLRDIHNLFMDTGIGQSAYSVMEQGKIDQLLSSKPEDRRAVFEEAAGITKFKTQKKEALRKLEYTEANLLRITDIIAELKRQMGSMQRQAQKARRYQEIHRDVRVLDTHLSHRKYLEFQAEASELATSIAALEAESEALHVQISTGETQIDDRRRELERTDAQLSALRLHASEQQSKIQSAEHRIAFNDERAREMETLIEKNEAEISNAEIRRADGELELRAADEALESIAANVARQQQQMAEHAQRVQTHKDDRERIDREIREMRRLAHAAETAIISANAQLSNNQAQIDSDSRRHEQLAAEVAKLHAEKAARHEGETTLTTEIASLQQQREEQTLVLQQAQHDLRQQKTDLDGVQKRLRETHRELTARKSRLEVLEQMVAKGEGLEKGTQTVLAGCNDPESMKVGVRGLLAAHLEVEPEYVRAVEAALGENLNAVLVNDHTLAERIIDHLTRSQSGEVVLLPENFLPPELPRQLSTLPDGSSAWAADRVKVSRPAGPIIDHLLGNVLVVPDLSTALALRSVYQDVAYATLTGEFVSAQGMIRGGRSTEKATSMLQRQNEIRELTADTATLSSQHAEMESQTSALQEQISMGQAAIEEHTASLQRIQLAESSQLGQQTLVRKELEACANRLESLEWEHAEVEKRRTALEGTVAGLQEALATAQLEFETHSVRVGELEHALAAAIRTETESVELLNELKTDLAVEQRAERALREQRDPMVNRLAEFGALIDRRQGEMAGYRERIVTAIEENERMRQEIDAGRVILSELEETLAAGNAQRAELARSITQDERLLGEIRRRSGTIAEQRGREEVRSTQIALRLENLVQGVAERYQTQLSGFEADVHTFVLTLNQVKARRATLEKRRATLAGRPADGEGSGEDVSPPNADAGEEGVDLSIDLNDTPIDWEEVELLVTELRQRIDAMGPVNLDAIQEFEELEERYNFLETEHNDLINSKTELLGIIQKINVETRRMFAETFEQIRKNFQQTFKELFGPTAYSNLALVNEEDPLESGIEVIAKPPGKKPTSITLLSGGEKSMTAVALLFSIYMVKPSPFCVLDELDAPLDESNIGRFLSMLDRFIDKSQFVIVTHNKKTMRRADVLYGITMEEFGVSKPVGMKIGGEEEKPRQRKESAVVLAGVSSA